MEKRIDDWGRMQALVWEEQRANGKPEGTPIEKSTLTLKKGVVVQSYS